MALSRLFAQDEELGKKDDDFRPASRRNVAKDLYNPSHSWVSGPRTRRRRLMIALAACILVYLFIHNMPDPLTPVGELVDIRNPTRTLRGAPVQRPRPRPDVQQVKDEKDDNPSRQSRPPMLRSEDVPPALRGKPKTAEHYYDGALKFYALHSSLNAITHTGGYREDNKNVLFVAGNVESASRIIPIACDMTRYERNYVHFAFLGRDPIDMEELKSLNGADRDCDIFWHDGRPDESQISSEARMEYSVRSALYHIESFMHPQAYLLDSGDTEERYFVKAMNSHTARTGKTPIELPIGATERMMWVTRLDHQSLASWSSAQVEILVHVPPNTSGSLIRLLKSIARADYSGVRMPHLTIELPPHIEPATQRFLDDFTWPPSKEGEKPDSKMTLRRRVSTAHLTPLEASIRTVESFYSARPMESHVLLLSTQVELSPLYYHYLFYHVLEYGYGWYSRDSYEQKHLAGIALDLPVAGMNGEEFVPPTIKSDTSTSETAFLWQAPDTHAALYFGSKWQELHSYLSHRISHPPSEPQQRTVSSVYPAFAEPLQELMRARNWFILYPHLPDGNTIATVHNELATAPEEYLPVSSTVVFKPKSSKHDALYLGPAEPSLPLPSHKEGPLFSKSLVALLPWNADLPELFNYPQLSWDGYVLEFDVGVEQAERYASKLRRNIGNCPASYIPEEEPNAFSADDLFCFQGNSVEDEAIEADPAAPTKTYEPVRAGLEAAIAPVKDKIPNAYQLHPTPASREKLRGGGSKEGDDEAMEPPNPATPGEMRPGASMQEIFEAEKAKARKQKDGVEMEQLAPKKGSEGFGSGSLEDYDDEAASLELASAMEKDKMAMQEEFRAHLERLSPENLQA